MQKDFKTLFEKWHSKTATDEEITELRKMLESPKYQTELTNLLEDSTISYEHDMEITHDRRSELLAQVVGEIDRRENSRAIGYRLKLASAVAATVVLAAFAGWWLLGLRSTLSSQELSNVRVIHERFVKLPDGTAITLNEGSTITYNSDEFGKEKRELVLSGEAFFDVAHNPDRPFIVRTDQVNTTVLGTAFNVSAYANKPIVVTVVRGKVKVGSIQREFETLLPNQELVIEPKTLAYERKDVKAEEKIEWMASYLVLNNVTMKEAAQMISKRYNTHVVLGDSSLTNCRISIFFVKNESLERVLETVSLAKGGDYTIKNGLATINGQCE